MVLDGVIIPLLERERKEKRDAITPLLKRPLMIFKLTVMSEIKLKTTEMSHLEVK